MPPRQSAAHARIAAEAVAALHPGAAVAPASPHLLAYRASIPFPVIGRLYISAVIGRESRSPRRIAREGQTRLGRAVIAAATLATLAFGLFCGLYLVKSFAGINLLPGPSPLHEYALFHG